MRVFYLPLSGLFHESFYFNIYAEKNGGNGGEIITINQWVLVPCAFGAHGRARNSTMESIVVAPINLWSRLSRCVRCEELVAVGVAVRADGCLPLG